MPDSLSLLPSLEEKKSENIKIDFQDFIAYLGTYHFVHALIHLLTDETIVKRIDSLLSAFRYFIKLFLIKKNRVIYANRRKNQNIFLNE